MISAYDAIVICWSYSGAIAASGCNRLMIVSGRSESTSVIACATVGRPRRGGPRMMKLVRSRGASSTAVPHRSSRPAMSLAS
jgi:hypothetical protein